MPRRKYNWSQLFADFELSGLSQTDFCKQHDINPKYFSLKLSKSKALVDAVFARAVVNPEPLSTAGITLEVGRCRIHCPNTLAISSFIALVNALA